MKRLLLLLFVLFLSPAPAALAGGAAACVAHCTETAGNELSASAAHDLHACSHCKATAVGDVSLSGPSMSAAHLPAFARGYLASVPPSRPERPKWVPLP